MRALVFFLIFGNLLFFAWTQGVLGPSGNPDALRLGQQLRGDQVRVLSRDEPPADAAAKRAKPERKETEACLLLADAAGVDLDRVEALVKERFAAARLLRSEAKAGGFWVFIPPLSGRAEAERKAAELKRLKVQDFFVMQEPAAQRFAISLGIFSSREAAEQRLDELRGKGVRSAKLGERDAAAQAGLEIHVAEASGDELRQALGEWAPKARQQACPAPRTGTP